MVGVLSVNKLIRPTRRGGEGNEDWKRHRITHPADRGECPAAMVVS